MLFHDPIFQCIMHHILTNSNAGFAALVALCFGCPDNKRAVL